MNGEKSQIFFEIVTQVADEMNGVTAWMNRI